MALEAAQRRELAQLMLVAREYLRIAAPPVFYADLPMGRSGGAFSKPMLAAADWSQTMTAANLASAAVRLASAEEILEKDLPGHRRTRNAEPTFTGNPHPPTTAAVARARTGFT